MSMKMSHWPAPFRILRSNLACVLIATALLAQSACVTVNVNFPESAVQSATDDYVKELYRAKEKGKNPDPSVSPSAIPAVSLAWPDLISSAQAAELRVDGEKSDVIRKRQAGRLGAFEALKREGALGESNDGNLVVRDASKVRNTQRVTDENVDRAELFEDFQKSKGIAKAHLADIRKSFARSFQQMSPPGTWVQDDDGNWTQKR